MKKLFGISVLMLLASLLATAPGARTPGAGAAADTSAAPPDTAQVRLRVDTAFTYVALEMTGSYDQHMAAFEKLFGGAAQQGIFGGTPFGVYWNSPADTPEDKLSWDVGFAAPAGQTPKEPLKLKKWTFTTLAVLDYSGAFEGEAMTKAYNKLFTWIGAHGYKPAGPTMEQYLNIPSADENGVLIGSIEIIAPVEKMPAKKETKTK
jgi:AraC family transcriptional regulator